MARRLRLASLGLSLAFAACSSKGECDAPTRATYGCQPQDGGIEGCPPLGSPDAAGPIYPKGCAVTLPLCSAFSPGTPQTCNCSEWPSADGSWMLAWICPS